MLIGTCRARRYPNIGIKDVSILELLYPVRPELHIFLTSQKGKGSGSINTVYLNTEQCQLQQAPGPRHICLLMDNNPDLFDVDGRFVPVPLSSACSRKRAAVGRLHLSLH